MNLEKFARQPLLFGPSPIHPLERLTKFLDGAEVWAKREDCNSGLAYGGNKTRKLEYLVADALAQGCDTLVSIGGVQSNHTRQVAAVAARLGMKCVLVQESWVNWPDSVYDKVGNILLSRILGADVRLVKEGFGIGFKASWEEALREVKAAGGKPYPIPAGASDHRLGGLGFAQWAQEVEQQEHQIGLFFDTIIVCSVTGSTQAGMIAGFAAQDRPRRVIGIDGSAKPAETRDQVNRIARQTAELINIGRDLRDDEIILDDRYHAGTYGLAAESHFRPPVTCDQSRVRRDMDQRSAAGNGRAARVAAAKSTVRRSHHACSRTRRARSQVASSRLAPMLMVPMRLSTNHSSSASPPGDEYSRRAPFRNPRGSVCRYPSRRNRRSPSTRPYSSTC
ncbi:MAG: 1-aminocyclopropane-1-carboxylate deaminase [Chloroflexi bacterium]|nr:MAG: 1-aminocyclopropane-1-carboxylate deaminase [Chloroflexota bacterium]